LRGRAGRQGDPGSSIFFISLQDELMRIFGGDSIDGMLKKLGLKENESIDHPWINKAMERAQQKVESRNFDVRKTLIKFDDVMNDQRRVIFSQRLKILKAKNIEEILQDFLDEILINLEKTKNIYQKSNDEKSYLTAVKNTTGNIINDNTLVSISSLNKEKFSEKIKSLYSTKKNERINIIGNDENNNLEKRIFLQIIDFTWRSHLQYLEQLRQVIGLRSYGQKDPLSEFKKEAFTLFEGLLEKIKNDVIKFLFNLNIVVSSEEQDKIREPKIPLSNQKVGRNEKCPCGSDKKYKHCCGSI
jgi:preprotein translocase subunit SecA